MSPAPDLLMREVRVAAPPILAVLLYDIPATV